MLHMIVEAWVNIIEILSPAWNSLESVLLQARDLHEAHPRIEGYLVGLLFSWMIIKRDKHPMLKFVSAPFVFIIDILDIVYTKIAAAAIKVWKGLRTAYSKLKDITGRAVSYVKEKSKRGKNGS